MKHLKFIKTFPSPITEVHRQQHKRSKHWTFGADRQQQNEHANTYKNSRFLEHYFLAAFFTIQWRECRQLVFPHRGTLFCAHLRKAIASQKLHFEPKGNLFLKLQTVPVGTQKATETVMSQSRMGMLSGFVL